MEPQVQGLGFRVPYLLQIWIIHLKEGVVSRLEIAVLLRENVDSRWFIAAVFELINFVSWVRSNKLCYFALRVV